MTSKVEFWLDPLCPWSWLTAEWLLEVQQQIPLEVDWRVMSLSILNEDADVPEEWRDLLVLGWGPVRALVAAREAAGPGSFVPLLGAIARRWHVAGRRDLRAIVDEAVAECGLPASVAERAWDTALDGEVREEHDRAMAIGGREVGSPVLGFTGAEGQVGFLGPVVAEVPRGDEAVRIFEATRTLALTRGFFELKRTRNTEPVLA